MKKNVFKWLKRLWALIAVKLIIIAVLVTAVRFVITGANGYKEQLIKWVATEHNINVSIDKISAGIDFSGLVVTLTDVNFVDAKVLPFELQLDHLFLHVDFLNSIKQQKVVFNDISLKGADLVLKPYYNLDNIEGEQSAVTLDSLKDIFLSRLNSFSIQDSTINYTDHLYKNKTIFIQDLSWLNDGDHHQGVGHASLLDTLDQKNTLDFVIDIKGDAKGSNDQLIGNLYANAHNLNAIDYLKPQINPLAALTSAVVSFKLWGTFDFNGPKDLQLKWGHSEISWSMLERTNDWKINDGILQFSYQDKHWLFDTYNLDIEHNYTPWTGVQITGSGEIGNIGQFDLKKVNLNSVLPFALLFSHLPEPDIKKITQLEIDGELSKIDLMVDDPGQFTVKVNVDAFNNQPLGAIPGISNADISITSNVEKGNASIKLAPQKIYFDGQFSRPMPVQKGDIELSWHNDENGFELISDNSVLVTDDLDSRTQFSLFFPGEKASDRSPFLSLYTYASLNDAKKAQYYLPIKAMGNDVFDYLQPTLQKGVVNGAKILWYGAFSDYPYQKHDGIFQAWVPLKNAQYDFYGEWEGLTDLDLDLLFENDYLIMESKKAKLGKITVDSLSGKIDGLNPNGILTIKADINDKAQYISKYLGESPLKDSVGKALDIIRIDDDLAGNLVLTIPFNREKQQTETTGTINLLDNDIDIELASDLIMPLKKVTGSFSFVNGDLIAEDLQANLFNQPVNFSFSTKELKDKYQLKADLAGNWNMAQLSRYHSELSALHLSGKLDWQGHVDFAQIFAGGYQFGVNLSSQLQGVKVNLPAPYYKNTLQSWPSSIVVKGDQRATTWDAKFNSTINSLGELNYQKEKKSLPYFYLGLGRNIKAPIDKTKQIIRINEASIDLTPWAKTLTTLMNKKTANSQQKTQDSLIDIDAIYVDIKHADLFEQPLVNLSSQFKHTGNRWDINLKADNFQSNIEYRKGTPNRYDINIEKMDFQSFDIDTAQAVFEDPNKEVLIRHSDNLRKDYPEIFLECKQCIYKKMDLSSLKAHVFPSKSRYTIDYLKLGEEESFTNISGVWDQRRTNIILDSRSDSETSIVRRLGYTGPMTYEKGELSGALNWVGAPWQFNFDSLNGALSTEIDNGLITEVNDKGARLLSFFSLDGIRRSLNLEFGNVFSKGLGFDKMTLSANITNGLFKSDDYYLTGSAGKISGEGLIDLPNLNVNYLFSYSPAVTSSLPVLAAFAINPLTGAAVLMLTKLLEPVVDTIVRVDFSVKGPLDNPVVKIISSQKGQVELQNSEVLEEMEENQPLENNQ
ncbi:TIGR02099 family protein [Psychromonas sp. RZ22]|uniref:YhdP family protein n=1 Tax=Psychromonas algarum TaxID=2555643 RepID=UPI0010672393|nr:YhdP family protein [Psychromonas sp. RZ22]TEW54328.1 TIGR02099 family protein [Psychromonas sp. RZ22]